MGGAQSLSQKPLTRTAENKWCNKIYEDLLQENESDRIKFLGSVADHFYDFDTEVVVSFPGVHGKAWNFLTEKVSQASSNLRTSCIFLPDEDAKGFGEHAATGAGGFVCHCKHLYGKKQAWGCAWYKLWIRKTLQARNCNLIVVTKQDGTLGRSQNGEVKFLEQVGLLYTKMTIKEFVIYYAEHAPEIEKREVSASLRDRMEKCLAARRSNFDKVLMLSRVNPIQYYSHEDYAIGLSDRFRKS